MLKISTASTYWTHSLPLFRLVIYTVREKLENVHWEKKTEYRNGRKKSIKQEKKIQIIRQVYARNFWFADSISIMFCVTMFDLPLHSIFLRLCIWLLANRLKLIHEMDFRVVLFSLFIWNYSTRNDENRAGSLPIDDTKNFILIYASCNLLLPNMSRPKYDR